MAKKIVCPKCKSMNWESLGDSKKKVSVGKGVIGGVLLGPVGAAAGAVVGKKGGFEMVCRDCGNRWIAKKL